MASLPDRPTPRGRAPRELGPPRARQAGEPFRVTLAVSRGSDQWVETALGGFTTDPGRASVEPVRIREYARVSLRFEASRSDAALFVEGLAEPLRPSPELREVTDPDEPGTWFPGVYQMRVALGDRSWHTLFRVEPQHVTIDALERMIADLESLVAGLAIDPGGVVSDRGRAGALAVRDQQAALIEDAWRRVEPVVQAILLDPRRGLERLYAEVPWRQVRRLDARSHRWLAVRGESLTSGRVPRRALAPQHRVHYDVYENQVAQRLLVNLRDAAQALSLAGTGSGLARIRLARVAGEVNDVLEHPLWDAAGVASAIRATPALFGDPRYAELMSVLTGLSRQLPRVESAPELRQRVRPTSFIYETWCLVRIVSELRALGFRLGSGWLAQAVAARARGPVLASGARDHVVLSVPGAGSSQDLVHPSGCLVRLVYDEALPRTRQEAKAVGSDFFIAGAHNRPDIRADLYLAQGDDWSYASSLIFEVKYRRLSRIWNPARYEQSDISTLQSYAYGFRRVESRTSRGTLHALAVLYPGHGDDPPFLPVDDQIVLVRLSPDQPSEHIQSLLQEWALGHVENSRVG